MQQQVRELRVSIDEVVQKMKLVPKPNRETSLCYTSLQKGFMYLGLLLGALGEVNPYPESSDPSSMKIENPADKFTGGFHPDLWDNRIASVKQLRADIQDILSKLDTLMDDLLNHKNYPDEHLPDWKKSNSIMHSHQLSADQIVDAKLWLGQELNNIHEQQKRDEIIGIQKIEDAKIAYIDFYTKQDKPCDWDEITEVERKYWIETTYRINNSSKVG